MVIFLLVPCDLLFLLPDHPILKERKDRQQYQQSNKGNPIFIPFHNGTTAFPLVMSILPKTLPDLGSGF